MTVRARLFATLLALPLALSACNPAAHPAATPLPVPVAAAGSGSDALIMRAYDVPQAYAAEIAGVVNRLMWRGQDAPRAGNAESGPGGMLLVTAPAGIHPGVEQIVARLKEKPPAPPSTVEITYWAVSAKRSDAAIIAPALTEIDPAIQALIKAEGPQTFSLLEKQRMHSLSGDDAKVLGNFFEIGQVASAREGKIVAQLKIRAHEAKASLETKVQLPQDDLLILGQSGIATPDKPQEYQTVYYVVRAHVIE